MKKGISVAGSILVDKLNMISAYPKSGELTQIREIKLSTGGCVSNVAIDLKKLSPELNVYGIGRVGTDEEGIFAKNILKKENIDVSDIIEVKGEKTSFTDVMSIKGGERTFFTYAGASANFCFEDIENIELAEMLHLGYFLLLDKIDNGDGLKILKEAKRRGVKTSIDLVSENSNRYLKVLPCLEYTDNIIINEIEAGKLAGIDNSVDNLDKIARKLKDLGVKERVIIHMPKRSICFDGKYFTEKESLKLPKGFIKGTTGAGDAFCAGALLGIYFGYSDENILSIATVSAAASLRTEDASSGLSALSKISKELSML